MGIICIIPIFFCPLPVVRGKRNNLGMQEFRDYGIEKTKPILLIA